MTITPEVKTFVGSEVAVETSTGTVQGTLLSCTTRSLWLVAGEDEIDMGSAFSSNVGAVGVSGQGPCR